MSAMRLRLWPPKARKLPKAAVALIEVEFDLQPVVSDAVQARQEGQPQIHEKGNLLKHIKVRKGDPEIGFAEADVVLEHTFHTPATTTFHRAGVQHRGAGQGDGRMEDLRRLADPLPGPHAGRPRPGLGREPRAHPRQLMGGGLAARKTSPGRFTPRCWRTPPGGPSNCSLTATKA
jgi:hypothetical protein